MTPKPFETFEEMKSFIHRAIDQAIAEKIIDIVFDMDERLTATAEQMELVKKGRRKQIWTHERVVELNLHQRNERLHPYTCGDRSNHPYFDGDKGVLVATVYGWICPFCDYTQNWAHNISPPTEDK